jgi:hypothetical protein
MEAIAAPLAEADGVARFNELYLAVTRAVEREAGSEVYEDPVFISRLDVVFDDLYFAAIDANATRRASSATSTSSPARSTTSWPTGASRPRVESPALDLGQRSMARAANAVESHGQHASTPPRRRARRAVERDPRPLRLGARFADT